MNKVPLFYPHNQPRFSEYKTTKAKIMAKKTKIAPFSLGIKKIMYIFAISKMKIINKTTKI